MNTNEHESAGLKNSFDSGGSELPAGGIAWINPQPKRPRLSLARKPKLAAKERKEHKEGRAFHWFAWDDFTLHSSFRIRFVLRSLRSFAAIPFRSSGLVFLRVHSWLNWFVPV